MPARSQIVDNLQVQLGASIDRALGQTLAQWERQNQTAAKRAQNAFLEFDRSVAKAEKQLLSFRNLAVVGVVAGLGALANRALSAVDAMDDAAAAAGLGVERFQELRFAAQFAGVSQDEFAAAMSRFAKVAGEAASGSEQAKTEFAALGVSVRDGNGNLKSQEQLLNEVIKAIGGYANQSERAAAAAGFFGREAGPKFAAFMAQGEAGINGLIGRAHELGLILDRETVQAAVKARDSLDTLGTVVETKLSIAMANAAPFITTVTDALIDLVAWASRAAGVLPGTVEGIRAELEDIQAVRERSQADTGAAAETLRFLGITPGGEAVSDRERALEQALAAKLAPPGYPGGAAPVAGLGQSPSDRAGRERLLNDLVRNIQTLEKTSAASSKRVADEWVERQAEAFDAGQSLMRDNIAAEDAAELAQLTRRMEALSGFEKQKSEARKAYEEAVDEMSLARVETEREAAENAAEAWGNALRGIAQNFDVLFDKTLSGWEKVGKIALDVLERIAVATATQMGGGKDPYTQAGGWLAGVLGGLLGGTPALPGGGGAMPGGTSHLASLPAGFRAEGGPVQSGAPYIVGERGPEPFFPAVNGRVLSHEDAMRALGGDGRGGGVVIHQTFNVSPGVPEAARREMMAMLPYFTKATKAAVQDDFSRNGSTARAAR